MKLKMELFTLVITAFLCQNVFADTQSKTSDPDLKGDSAKISTNKDESDDNAESPLTGYLTLTTNYMFRGFSVSNNLPAVQGALTYTFQKTGIYLNVWASNTDFPASDGAIATIEIDSIIGISNDIGDHFNYNLSYARYNYPKARYANYNEALLNLGFYFLTASAGYSGNVFNVHESGLYYNGGVTFDIPAKHKILENMSIAATIGRYNLPTAAGKSYNDYAVTLSKDIGIYSLSLQWTDTNHKLYDNSLDHSHIIGTVTANF